MIIDYDVIDTILFSEPLGVFAQRLRAARKDSFQHRERIVILQDVADTYPYIDSAGAKLIEIQKIINSVDISNCFILLVTTNPDAQIEIDFVTKFYSVDPYPMELFRIEGDYKKEVIKYANTACKKLWNHLYIGPDKNVNPCCFADHRFPLGSIIDDSVDSIINSDKSNQIRQWMAQGYRSIACNQCYSKEDSGIFSARNVCDPTTQNIDINSLDVRLNNICNFKCRMCSEYFSSSIQQETIELYGKDATLGYEQVSLQRSSHVSNNFLFNKVLPYITDQLKMIYFAGGEPLISREHYQILDRLIELGHTRLSISYNTNLSQLQYKNLNVIDYWNQFSNVTVGASIDASDAVAEYVRNGTVWSDVLHHISLIKNSAPNVKLQITSTVSFLTIENLIKLQVKWVAEGMFQAGDLSVKALVEPKYLSPAVLPQHHKKRLGIIIQQHIDWLGNNGLASQWRNVLKFMNDNDYSHSLDEFKHRTGVLDKHRGESFMAIFPEFQDLYD